MSLELLLGAAADVRSDVYALAVRLFELISGELPFVQFPYEYRLLQLQLLKVPCLRDRAGVPRALARSVARAMARERQERFATVAEFASCLKPFAGGTRFTTRRICSQSRWCSAEREKAQRAESTRTRPASAITPLAAAVRCLDMPHWQR